MRLLHDSKTIGGLLGNMVLQEPPQPAFCHNAGPRIALGARNCIHGISLSQCKAKACFERLRLELNLHWKSCGNRLESDTPQETAANLDVCLCRITWDVDRNLNLLCILHDFRCPLTTACLSDSYILPCNAFLPPLVGFSRPTLLRRPR